MHLAHCLGLLHRAEKALGRAFREVGGGHRDEQDVFHQCTRLARQCDRHAEALGPFAQRYGEDAPDEPERLHSTLFEGTRLGPLGLLRDLHDLYLMACECDMAWTLVGQAAQGARDTDPLEVVRACEGETAVQLKCKDVAGVVGLVLCGVAVYAALAMALEEARRATVLPTGRRGMGLDVENEPGIRPQL